MTDAELWGEFAEMLEGAGVMPERCSGLCDMLYMAFLVHIIYLAQMERMIEKLYAAKKAGGHAFRNCGEVYFWPSGKVKPRIAACRQLMREALERDGK